MKLCTFEVSTQLGRHLRLGAVSEKGIVDLNFAYASYLASRDEPRPHQIANAVLPPAMLEFLKGGAPAIEAARAACLHAKTGLRGPNDETLVYTAGEVRMRTPLPNPPSVRDFYAFEQHVKTGFERRGEP